MNPRRARRRSPRLPIGSQSTSLRSCSRRRRRPRRAKSNRWQSAPPGHCRVMAGGLFQLRNDRATGWWGGLLVAPEFQKERFHRPEQHRAQSVDDCANCQVAAEDLVRLRMLKPEAFIVAGTETEKDTEMDGREPSLGMVGDSGSWQTILAPRGHHEALAETTPQIAFELLTYTRNVLQVAREQDKTEYLQVVQNFGKQAGALTDHLCLDFYDLPQIPHRVGEELGGAARFVIREGICPFCRLVRDEVANGERLVYEDAA